MSGRITSRKESLRRVHELAERTKDQWAEDPQIEDSEVPEAVERRSAETANLEEEA